MSDETINSQINRLKANVANTYTELDRAHATLPETENSDNLKDTTLTIADNLRGIYLFEDEKIEIDTDEYEIVKITDARRLDGFINQDKTITANGTYTKDEPYTGLGTVTVDVPPHNQDKTITENGTYTASTEYTGLGTVTVDVLNVSEGEARDALLDIKAALIDKGLDVTNDISTYGDLIRSISNVTYDDVNGKIIIQ